MQPTKSIKLQHELYVLTYPQMLFCKTAFRLCTAFQGCLRRSATGSAMGGTASASPPQRTLATSSSKQVTMRCVNKSYLCSQHLASSSPVHRPFSFSSRLRFLCPQCVRRVSISSQTASMVFAERVIYGTWPL